MGDSKTQKSNVTTPTMLELLQQANKLTKVRPQFEEGSFPFQIIGAEPMATTTVRKDGRVQNSPTVKVSPIGIRVSWEDSNGIQTDLVRIHVRNIDRLYTMFSGIQRYDSDNDMDSNVYVNKDWRKTIATLKYVVEEDPGDGTAMEVSRRRYYTAMLRDVAKVASSPEEFVAGLSSFLNIDGVELSNLVVGEMSRIHFSDENEETSANSLW